VATGTCDSLLQGDATKLLKCSEATAHEGVARADDMGSASILAFVIEHVVSSIKQRIRKSSKRYFHQIITKILPMSH